MASLKKVRVTVSLWPWQIKKAEAMARRFWPSLKPRECRSAVLATLLNYVDARSGDATQFTKRSGLR